MGKERPTVGGTRIEQSVDAKARQVNVSKMSGKESIVECTFSYLYFFQRVQIPTAEK